MDPLDALTTTDRTNPADDSAPAAAHWLSNPTSIAKRRSPARELAEDKPWVFDDAEENLIP